VVEEAGEDHRPHFITCGCESSAPFFVIYKTGREPTPVSGSGLKTLQPALLRKYGRQANKNLIT